MLLFFWFLEVFDEKGTILRHFNKEKGKKLFILLCFFKLLVVSK
jgi:hypothetical protein